MPAEVTSATSNLQNTDEPNPSVVAPSPAPLKTFKIMSRTPSQRSSSRQTNSKGFAPSSSSSVSSADANTSDPKRNELSYEARQAAYLQARNRIFASDLNEATDNKSAQPSDNGIPEDSAESEPNNPTPVNNGSSDELAESAHPKDLILTSSALSSNGTQTRAVKIANKGKERMAASLRSAKLAAKLRPGATSFDPNAKAHGYEEVTIIDFDQPHPPVHWSNSGGYPYPTDPNYSQFPDTRGSRPGHFYGHSSAGTVTAHQNPLSNGVLHGHQTLNSFSYPTYAPSTDHHTPFTVPPPTSHVISGGMPHHPQPHQGSFVTGPGSFEANQTRQAFSQYPDSCGRSASDSSGKPSNVDASGPRAQGQYTPSHELPYPALCSSNHEMGIFHMMPPERMSSNNGSHQRMSSDRTAVGRSMRPQFASQESSSVSTRAVPSRGYQAVDSQPPTEGQIHFPHSSPYPPHHQMQHVGVSQHRMTQYNGYVTGGQANSFDNRIPHPSAGGPAAPIWFQPSPASEHFQASQPAAHDGDMRSGTLARPNLPMPMSAQQSVGNPQSPYSANPQLETCVTPGRVVDSPTFDPRVQPSKSINYRKSAALQPFAANSQHPSPPLHSAQKRNDSHLPYPSNSSMSSSSTDSSTRTPASSLSRSMNNMKLGGPTDPIFNQANLRPSSIVEPRPIGPDHPNRYPRAPSSAGNLSASLGGSSREVRAKKHDQDNHSAEPNEAGSIKSSHSGSDGKSPSPPTDRASAESSSGLDSRASSLKAIISTSSLTTPEAHSSTQDAESNFGQTGRDIKGCDGSTNSTAGSDVAASTNSSEPPRALQHPLPPKPLWAAASTQVGTKATTKAVSANSWSHNLSSNSANGHAFRGVPSNPVPGDGSSLNGAGHQLVDQPGKYYHQDDARPGAVVYPSTFQNGPSASSQMTWHHPYPPHISEPPFSSCVVLFLFTHSHKLLCLDGYPHPQNHLSVYPPQDQRMRKSSTSKRERGTPILTWRVCVLEKIVQ